MTDIGISCQKEAYGRTAGKPLVCKSTEDEQAALCYTPCRDGYHGVGPVCWSKCPTPKHDCSALCTDQADGCTDTVKDITVNVVALAVAAAVAETGGKVDIV